MLALGINNGVTSFLKPLKDGGASLLDTNGNISAISEERLTKIKGSGGFYNSVQYLLENKNISINDIDVVVYSSCCEFNPAIDPIFKKFNFRNKVIEIPSHHFSHACSSFYLSGFDEALVIIMDSGGNVLNEMNRDMEWWNYKREQMTSYIASNNEINLIGSDFENPNDAGIGEIFRAFTKFLGWKTKYAGKLMSLASFAKESLYKNTKIFDINEYGKLTSVINNNPNFPIQMITDWARINNLNLESPRKVDSPILEEHIHLANFIQTAYENIICRKIEYLCQKYKTKNLCLAGGVALNCVANSKILQNTPIENLFIQPAAGDQGQCLGNAIWGTKMLMKKVCFPKLTNAFLSPYSINISITDIVRNENYSTQRYFTVELKHPEQTIGDLIFKNFIIGHAYGKSEFGPRALGHRSIFASPMIKENKEKLNEIKKRENFNPFAASILLEYYPEYFFNPAIDSPFMLLTAKVRENKKQLIPAVLHEDQTSRIQTVSKDNCSRLYGIILEYYKLSGIPIILNTSLNSTEQPICEDVTDILKTFSKLDLDGIIIHDFLIVKKSNLRIAEYVRSLQNDLEQSD